MKKRYVFLLCIVVVSLIFGAAFYLQNKDDKPEEVKIEVNDLNSYQDISYSGDSYSYNTNIRSILLLGIDGKEDDPLSGQSDFMALMIFDIETNEFNCLMIPRDTMTVINVNDNNGEFVTSGVDHITLAYPYGGGTHYYGGQNSLTAVSKLLNNIPFRNYLIMPLDILRDLVKVMGETDIILQDDSLAYIDEKYVKGYKYHIDEESIELFLRSRDITTDFSAGNRTDRQVIYLQYLMNKFKDIQEGRLNLSFRDLDSIFAKCESNLTNVELSNYYNYMLEAKLNDDAFQTIPGEYQMGTHYDEFHYDVDKLLSVVINLFYIKN